MTIDYATLIGGKDLDSSIKNMCNDSRVPSKAILTEAQQWIYQRLRVRQMLTRKTDAPLTAAADTIALPTDWQYPYALWFIPNAAVVKSKPKFKPLDFVIDQWGYSSGSTRSTGRPSYWATDAASIQFDKVADQEYPTLIVYYAHKAELAPNNATNFLTDRYFGLLKATCLAYAYQHQQNDKWTRYWRNEAEVQVNLANADSDQQLEGMENDVSPEPDW